MPPAPDSAPHRPPLTHGVALVALGNGLFNVARIAVIALLAKFTTPDFVGAFHAATAWSTPIILLLGLELRPVLISDAGNQLPFAVYRRLRNLGLGVALLVLCGETIRQGITSNLAPQVLVLTAAVWGGRWALASAELYWGLFQKQERLGRIALSNALRGLAMILPLLIATLAARRWLGISDTTSLARIAAGAIALHVGLWLLIGYGIDRPAARGLPPAAPVTARQLRTLLYQALPLGVVALLVNLCDNVPRLIIDHQPDGAAALGYFGTLAQIPLAAQFLMVQVGTASSNRLAQYRYSDPARFHRLFLRLTATAGILGLAIFLVGWLAGPWLLRVLFTADYARHSQSFLIMVTAQCVILFGSIFGFVATQMRYFWRQVPLQLALLSTTWVAAAWLIPGDPVRGGAWTMLIRAVAQSTLYGACIFAGLRRKTVPDSPPSSTSDVHTSPRGKEVDTH